MVNMEQRYMISDAAKKVNVETHVLRYWEEELDLKILRNEMGHRYYTEEDINMFQNIKILKEQGFQLKAVKTLIPKLRECKTDKLDDILALKDELNYSVMQVPSVNVARTDNKVVAISGKSEVNTISTEPANDKMQQFQRIIKNIVSEALAENNHELGREVGSRVSDNVLKEMDYLMKVQDEKEEERFKRLDEVMRLYQRNRKEIAAAEEGGNGKVKKKKRFKIL